MGKVSSRLLCPLNPPSGVCFIDWRGLETGDSLPETEEEVEYSSGDTILIVGEIAAASAEVAPEIILAVIYSKYKKCWKGLLVLTKIKDKIIKKM